MPMGDRQDFEWRLDRDGLLGRIGTRRIAPAAELSRGVRWALRLDKRGAKCQAILRSASLHRPVRTSRPTSSVCKERPQRSEVSGGHFAPIGRPMRDAGPHIERVPDAFIPEGLAELVIALREVVGYADGQPDVE